MDDRAEDDSLAVAVLSSIGEAVVVTDATGIITFWNPAAERIYGYSSADAVGRNGTALLASQPSAEQADAIMRALTSGNPWSGRFLCRRKDGSIFPVQATDTPITDNTGRLVAIVCVFRDVADEQLHHGILEAAQEGIVKIQDRIVTFSNAAASRILRLPASEIVGRPLSDFVDKDHLPFADAIRARLLAGEAVRAELTVRTGDGERRLVAISASPLRDESNNNFSGTVTLFTDITDHRSLEQESAFRAAYDELTGLLNRSVLVDRLQWTISARKRIGGRDLAVLFCDIDRFKEVNESSGHDAGDLLLAQVAERISETVRPRDVVARFGGDEFVVVCDGITGTEDAQAIARRIQAALCAPFVMDDGELDITCSIGVAFMNTGSTAERLLADADAAVRQAKRLGGGGRVCVSHDSLRQRAAARLQLQSDLRQAMDGGEFVCYHQPIVDITTGLVVGVEALLRWRHPQRGLVTPDGFLGAAEESGLIIRLGEWALEAACADVMSLRGTLRGRLHVAANVSARQFAEGNFAERVAAIVTKTGIEPSRLVLEVIETTVMDDTAVAAEVMSTLRDEGVRFAVDDFGTGYSSLLYLKEFPIDQLKIDRSFVGGLGRSTDDSAIVASVVSMSRAMSRTCVAEGVETIDQLQRLRQLGCDYAQGYLFSDAVPISELPAAVARIEAAMRPRAPRPTRRRRSSARGEGPCRGAA